MSVTQRRDHIRAMLADLKLPGALEAVERLLDAQITLRRNRRLQTAMRSSRLPAIKTHEQFDFAFQPSIQKVDLLSESNGSSAIVAYVVAISNSV